MKFKFNQIDWDNDGTNTLVSEGKEYRGLRYIEDGVYEFSFDFPQDKERIREHFLVLARILIAAEWYFFIEHGTAVIKRFVSRVFLTWQKGAFKNKYRA